MTEIHQNEEHLTKVELENAVRWLLTEKPVSKVANNEIDVKNLTGDGFVNKIYNYFKDKNSLSVQREGWIVDITKSGLKATRSKGLGANKINAIAAIPEIIMRGIVVDVNNNWKGRGYNSYIIDAPIEIEGEEFIAEIVVNKGKDGKGNFYVHEVEEKQKLLGIAQTGMDTGKPIGASKLRVSHLLKNVK